MTLKLQFGIAKLRFCLILKTEFRKNLNKIIKVYNQVKRLLLISQVAKLYIVSKINLYYRRNDCSN